MGTIVPLLSESPDSTLWRSVLVRAARPGYRVHSVGKYDKHFASTDTEFFTFQTNAYPGLTDQMIPFTQLLRFENDNDTCVIHSGYVL